MKKLSIGLIVVGLIIFFSSIIVVDERQAVATLNPLKQQKIYGPGVHFVLPIWNKITYVYTNSRTALIMVQPKSDTFQGMEVELKIDWQVFAPGIYLEKITKHNKAWLNQQLQMELANKIDHLAESTDLEHLNSGDMIFSMPYKINDLGIVIDNVAFSGFNKERPIKHQSISKVNTESNNISLNMTIESAYYQALIIKSKTNLMLGQVNQELMIKDPKFYDFYSSLNYYKNIAKTASDMPALKDLYPEAQ